MAATEEITLLLARLRNLENSPRTPSNASIIEIGIASIRERLSALSRRMGFLRVSVV